MIAAAAGPAVVAWDAETGALLHAEDRGPDPYAVFDLRDISLAAPFRLHLNKMSR